MCGIGGYLSNKSLIKDNSINSTLKIMERRGPDNRGYIIKDYQKKSLALLHTRLNIIDLNKRSNQPYYENGLTLVFNGEIYNYLEIKEKLKKKYNFKTSSDTEVLIKAYQEWGENCVNHFIGMWAFAIWDENKKKLFLSRDQFGEKPLYYYAEPNGFFFGSEIKIIKSLCKKKFDINKNQINKGLFLGYKSLHKTNNSFFKNIYSLESSTNLLVDLNFSIKKKKYWKPKLKINFNLKENDVVQTINELLVKSIKLRMRSDVPIAFCLSGGIDSSILASHASKTLKKKISTFTIIDNDYRYNEIKNVNEIIKDLRCKSNYIYLKKDNIKFFERINELTNYHDGPITIPSYFIHSFLSEAISKNKFRVAISGTGADEIFTGYYDHFLLHLNEIKGTKYYSKNLKNWRKFIKPTIRNPLLKKHNLYINDNKNRENVFESNFNLIKYARNYNGEDFTEKNYTKNLFRNRMLNELFQEVVPVILKHDDHNSMYHSVENRSPYLDKDLLEYSLTIPPHLLISDGYQKKLLRDASKEVLIKKIRLDRQKKGFNASISSLINFNDKNFVEAIFNEKSHINDYINLKKLRKNVNFDNVPNHLSKFIFSIISTNIFLKNADTE